MASVLTASGGFALSAADRERLVRRTGDAIRRARRHHEALAAITIALGPSVDPSAVVAASRRGGEAAGAATACMLYTNNAQWVRGMLKSFA